MNEVPLAPTQNSLIIDVIEEVDRGKGKSWDRKKATGGLLASCWAGLPHTGGNALGLKKALAQGPGLVTMF